MPDRKLEYWYDWTISGPEDMVFDLRSMGPPIEKERLTDIDYLCRIIDDYADRALMNQDVWYQIVMLRKRAFKDENMARDLKRVCKSISGDGRKRKKRDDIDDLRAMIRADIRFFRKIRDRVENDNTNVDEAISDWLTHDARSQSAVDRRLGELSNYRGVYYAYKRIYGQLSDKMTDSEIFAFFEKAAEHVGNPDVVADTVGRNGRIEFIKTSTWYVEGDDMVLDLGPQRLDCTDV